jgi:hypothetical protein
MPASGLEQIVGVFDCLSARIASTFDFDWLHIGGYNLSASAIGQPDVGLLTLTENVERVRAIVPHCSRPVLVDGDDGYGNHLTVIRLVREMERAGASAIHLDGLRRRSPPRQTFRRHHGMTLTPAHPRPTVQWRTSVSQGGLVTGASRRVPVRRCPPFGG